VGIATIEISKTHAGATAFTDVSIEIPDGSIVMLLGATGAGKTSLVRVLAGIDAPDGGTILYDGEDVTRKGVRARPVAMVYQQFVNYPSMTVYENIASPLRVQRPRVDAAALDRTVRETAALLGLGGILEQRPSEISGGQQQRTAIARALAKGARYIFLDEPLANLDYKLREELRGELAGIFRTRGGAVVSATTDPLDALAMGTAVGFMHNGRLEQFGRLDSVYEHPATAEAAAFFSHPAMNLVEADCVCDGNRVLLKVDGDLAVDVSGIADSLTAPRYTLGFRAHALQTTPAHGSSIPIAAEVLLAEVVGSDIELHVRHGEHDLVAFESTIHRHAIGERVTLHLDPRQCFVFDTTTRALVGRTAPVDA